MNGSSSTVSPFVSGTKKRFSPTPSASAIFSSVPRLGVICPLSIRDKYERETRERACSWLCVMLRDSRNCRIRWPMFSTVSRFGQFSNSWRSSPANPEVTVSVSRMTPWGAACASTDDNCQYVCGIEPIHRLDSELLHGRDPCLLLCFLFPPPVLPRRLFRRCEEEGSFDRGKAGTARE